MSKTFTSRPAGVSQRGRGRGRGQSSSTEPAAVVGTTIPPSIAAQPPRGAARGSRGGGGRGGGGGGRGGGGDRGQRTGPGVKGAAGGKDSTTSSRSTLQERTSYAGGFTVIRPDEKRRREVTEQAEREARQYEQFRKQNKPTSFSYVGTAGGGEEVSVEEARQQQVRTQAQHSKTSRLVREQERRSQQRQQEDRALADRKEAARNRASLNAQRQNNKEDNNWKSEMKRVNRAFLDRLEAESKRKGASSEDT